MKKRILNKKKKQNNINMLYNIDNGLSLRACKRILDKLRDAVFEGSTFNFNGNVVSRIKKKNIVYK